MGINRATLGRIKKKLNGMLAGLEAEVANTVDGMRVGTGAFPDPTDRASLESDRNLTLRIRDRERKLKNKIEDAIARIEDGTFGPFGEGALTPVWHPRWFPSISVSASTSAFGARTYAAA